MENSQLRTELYLLIDRYGIDEVSREMKKAKLAKQKITTGQRKFLQGGRMEMRRRQKGSKITAPGYVAKMDIPSERQEVMLVLADRFEEKLFLPTFADIRNFCRIYDIAEPASRTRVGAIPRIFKFVASMNAGDIQNLLDENAFSGPSRLDPLAEAIRTYGRAARHRDTDDLGLERGTG